MGGLDVVMVGVEVGAEDSHHAGGVGHWMDPAGCYEMSDQNVIVSTQSITDLLSIYSTRAGAEKYKMYRNTI